MPSTSTRLFVRAFATALALAGAGFAAGTPASSAAMPGISRPNALPDTPAGTPHDFDFEHGRWHTVLRRRLHPLSGTDDWASYEGTTVVTPVWGGRANLVELDVRGPAGHLEGLSLRLFDTSLARWTLNFSNAATGTLAVPMTGGFAGTRRGVFYSRETLAGRPILVRFVIESTSQDACRFEQAFSPDDGATWETNWVAVDTRARG